MKTNRLLMAGLLVAMVGTPIAALRRTTPCRSKRHPKGNRLAFLHGLSTGKVARPIGAGLACARERVAQFAAADGRRAPRQGRARRFLDLHLHQLAAHAVLTSAPGRRNTRTRDWS